MTNRIDFCVSIAGMTVDELNQYSGLVKTFSNPDAAPPSFEDVEWYGRGGIMVFHCFSASERWVRMYDLSINTFDRDSYDVIVSIDQLNELNGMNKDEMKMMLDLGWLPFECDPLDSKHFN